MPAESAAAGVPAFWALKVRALTRVEAQNHGLHTLAAFEHKLATNFLTSGCMFFLMFNQPITGCQIWMRMGVSICRRPGWAAKL